MTSRNDMIDRLEAEFVGHGYTVERNVPIGRATGLPLSITLGADDAVKAREMAADIRARHAGETEDSAPENDTVLNGPEPQAPARPRQLVKGGDPDQRYPVPPKLTFGDQSDLFKDDRDPDVELIDFLPAGDLEEIGRALIRKHDARFGDLRELSLAFAWKREGGATEGRSTLGRCVKTTGLLKYLGEVDFVIWIAADHARRYQLTRWQIEALLYRELLRAGTNEKGKPVIYAFDFHGFRSEVLEYGPWSADLQRAGDAFQPHLPGMEE